MVGSGPIGERGCRMLALRTPFGQLVGDDAGAADADAWQQADEFLAAVACN